MFRSAVIAAFAIVFAFSIGISSPPIVRADAPGQGTFFEYNYDWYVDQGSGTYDERGNGPPPMEIIRAACSI